MRNGDRWVGWGLALVLSVGIGLVWERSDAPRQPELARAVDLTVTSDVDCAALAVMAIAPDGDWLEQAMVVQVVLNRGQGGRLTPCEVVAVYEPLGRRGRLEVQTPDNLAVWYQARAVARAVIAGDYTIAPVVCSWATDFILRTDPLPADHESCEVGRFAFLIGPVPLSGAAAYAGQQPGADDLAAAAVRVAATFPGED